MLKIQPGNIRKYVVLKEPVPAEVMPDPNRVEPQIPATRLCVACQAPVTTRFCGHCGRKVHQSSVLLDTTVHTAQVLMNIDGRWRRTLSGLCLRPGQMLQRYLAGERHCYANPVLMLLVLTSLQLLAIGQLQPEYNQYSADEKLNRLFQWLIVFSGYVVVGSNVVTAWLSRRCIPDTTWTQRFVVLTYTSVFTSLAAFPLMLLAHLFGHDLTSSYLMWLGHLAGGWILWGYRRSIKSTLWTLLLSFVCLILCIGLIGFFVGLYLELETDVVLIRQLPQLLTQQPIY